MGYMGLDHVNDSDGAADLAIDITDAMVKVLRRGLKEKGNDFNPDGCVNVALFFRDFILPCTAVHYRTDDGLKKLAEETIELLNTNIENASVKNKGEWDSESNRKYHLTEYRKMKRNLLGYLRKCD